MVKHVLLASAMMLSAYAQAQTVATFDNLTLPNSDTLYMDLSANGYAFSSGLASLHGSMMDYGGGIILTEGFTYANINDTTQCTSCYDLHYMNANRQGRGYNGSDKYAVAYAYSPASVTLDGAATGNPVAGFMLSNTSWAYAYAQQEYASNTGDSAILTIKGFLNGVQTTTDPIVVFLADYRTTTPAAQRGVLDSWQWVNLSGLGNVDSLTFRVTSSDDFFPSYFVMDNLVTMESGFACQDTMTVTAGSITENSALIEWVYPSDTTFDGNDSFEVVINQSATVSATDVPVAVVNQLSYPAATLNAHTTYYAHVRAYCHYATDFTSWTTVSFTTEEATGIYDRAVLPVQLYPNPTSGVLYFEYEQPLTARVMDMNGTIVLQQAAAHAIDTRTLAAGAYFIRLSAANGKSVVLPFVKK